MKKAMSILLAIILLCTMLPMSGLAGGGLGLFVSGVEVTGTTPDVLGDGTVAFDASTSTLTLKNAGLVAGASDHKAISVTDSSSLTRLTINLSGSNTILLNPNGGAADLGGIVINKGLDLKITGSGSLDITDKGTGKLVISGPGSIPAAFIFMPSGSGSLTIGEEDGSAPGINITCNRVVPFMAMCDPMTNYGKITVSVPSADGFSQAFNAANLMNYGGINVSCDAFRPDMGTALMSVAGVNEGIIELTASTGGGSLVAGIICQSEFTNNGTLKVGIGGDTSVKALTAGIYAVPLSFTNTGSCELQLNNISAGTAVGIEASSVENTGAIEIRMTDVGRNEDNDDQVAGMMVIGPVNNYSGGSIFIKIGDSIAPGVTGLEAVAGTNNNITNAGMINVEIGNTPNCQARGIHTEGNFHNSGSVSSVDIDIGDDATTPLGQGAFGLSVAVQGGTQVLTNEGTINVGIIENMPGQAIVVTGELINTATGKISARAKEYGVYLDTASLSNQGVLRAYGYVDGTGLYVKKTATNDGLIYATGRLRALYTGTGSIGGSGSKDWDAEIDNLDLIDYDGSEHEYYVHDTSKKVKTFYSVTPLMAYKQDKTKELEETMKSYVSENARQAMEYWRDEILNAATTGEVDEALASGLMEMAEAEDAYFQAKEYTKKELEELLSKVVTDEAKQIVQDAIDGLDFILNSAAFADLIPIVRKEAEYADFLYNTIAELEEAKNNAISDEAKDALDEAIRKVKDATTEAEVNDAKAAGLDAAGEADKALKDARDAAIAELEELGKTTCTSDEALAAMEDAIAAIQAATNLPDVAAALEAGRQAMADADALQKAIADAAAELENAKGSAISDEAKAALDEAIQKVKAATTADEVTAAKEAGLKAAEDADKALKDARDAAIAELEAAKDTAISDEAKAALDEAIQKVKAATTADEVTAAKEAGLKAAEDADKALKDAREAAIAELEELGKTTCTSDEALAAMEDAIAAIQAATNMPDVAAALEAGRQAMADADAMQKAIADAAAELENAKGNAISDEAKAALDEAIQKVKAATTADEVTAAKEAGLKAAEDADKALKDARDAAIAELEAAKDTAISDEAKAALDEAIQKVKAATTADEVTAVKEAGLKAAEDADKALKDARDAAIAELEELGRTTYTSDEALAAMETAIAAIRTATNLPDVAAALKAGKQAMANAGDLKKAIADAAAELESARDKAISDEAKAALDEAIQKVKAATTADGVTAAKEAGLKAAEDADKALKDARNAAIAELEELGRTTYTSDEALAAMETAIAAIRTATNLPDVAAALKAGKQAMANAGDLKKAIADAAAELEAARDKAVSDKAKAALDEAIRKVKAATTADEVTAAKEAGLKDAADNEKALADAIAAALSELDEAKATASDEADVQIDDAKTGIAAATSVTQVDELLAALYDAIFDIRYVLLEGNGLEWVKDSDVTAKFRSSAPYEKFDSVEIDNKPADTSDYTSENGSTIIWLKPGMLMKLSAGRHRIVIRSADGLARGYFNVKPAMPPTGDRAEPFLWTSLLMMSLGLVVTAILMKRRKQ